MSDTYGYGSHPTSLMGLSDGELYAMYRGENWFSMDEFARLELLQETVNRAASQNGELGSCRVEFVKMDHNTAGRQYGDVIQLNREMYVDDLRLANYNGQLIQTPLQDSNLHALTTVLHEDQHAYQNQIINGVIQASDSSVRQEYAANNFGVVQVLQNDGLLRTGSTYLSGNTPGVGYYLYYFQSTERDAHRFSEEKTAYIMDYLTTEYGNEPSFYMYRTELRANGYDATVSKAKEIFGDINIDHEINQSLMNHYYHTFEPVNAQINALVQVEMINSYEAMMRPELSNNTHSDNGMREAQGVSSSYPNLTDGTDNESVTSSNESSYGIGME